MISFISVLICVLLASFAYSFSPPSNNILPHFSASHVIFPQKQLPLHIHRKRGVYLLSSPPTEPDDCASSENESFVDTNDGGEETIINKLPPASQSGELNGSEDLIPTDGTITSTIMITRELKRVLVEELGYRIVDVEKLRYELAAPIASKRIRCPEEGMPESWIRKGYNTDISSQERMRSRLESESKYPLKIPLLAVSTILAGKGLTDLVVTVLKVNAGIRGASLTEEFLGLPVLAIDALCVVIGVSLGLWTWKSMR